MYFLSRSVHIAVCPLYVPLNALGSSKRTSNMYWEVPVLVRTLQDPSCKSGFQLMSIVSLMLQGILVVS